MRARDNIIASRGTGYALVAPVDAVDAWRFDRLVRKAATLSDPAQTVRVLADALALWRGPALSEYVDQSWAQAEVARLGELRAVAREQLLAARLDSGESAVLVPEIEALVTEQPLREERWRLLVLALYRAHRQGDALAALRRARQTLADELGVDPGPALRSPIVRPGRRVRRPSNRTRGRRTIWSTGIVSWPSCGPVSMRRWRVSGRYLNFVTRAVDTSTGYAPDAWRRLRAVRAAYDPTRLLVANHPIPPTAG